MVFGHFIHWFGYSRVRRVPMTKDERSFGLLVLHLVANGQVADLMRLESSRLFREIFYLSSLAFISNPFYKESSVLKPLAT